MLLQIFYARFKHTLYVKMSTTSTPPRSSHPIFQSPLKLKVLETLIEELAKPALDFSEISQYSSMVIGKMRQQNLMAIPLLVQHIKKRDQPLVLEITNSRNPHRPRPNNVAVEQKEKLLKDTGSEGRPLKRIHKSKSHSFSSTLPRVHGKGRAITKKMPSSSVSSARNNDVTDGVQNEMASTSIDESSTSNHSPQRDLSERMIVEDVPQQEKQVEIIFSDSVQAMDPENDQHIVHSITERAATPQQDGTIQNEPDSFPLFQIVHDTGQELSEEMQQEIVRLIKEANPKLDLNSITFKLKSPDTVEIIANVNS